MFTFKKTVLILFVAACLFSALVLATGCGSDNNSAKQMTPEQRQVVEQQEATARHNSYPDWAKVIDSDVHAACGEFKVVSVTPIAGWSSYAHYNSYTAGFTVLCDNGKTRTIAVIPPEAAYSD